jgi:hypothetical protein
LIPLSWGLGGAAAALAVGLSLGYVKGHHDGFNGVTVDWQAEQLRQANEFAGRLAEANTQLQRMRAADRAKDATYEATMRDVDRRHHAAVAGLRKRAERAAVPASGAGVEACQGSTGAQLSRPDAEFLAGLAARADELRAALERCQGGDIARDGTRMDR